MNMRWLPLWVAALLLPVSAWGAGFSLYEQGGRALGQGGAYTARVGDASGIFFNPAGLARVENGEILGGTSMIVVSREFAGVNPYPGYGSHAESPTQAFFPFHIYWAERLGDDFVVGFGVYNPFGLTTEWKDPDSFPGRFISTKASITPFYFNPTVAVSLAPWLRAGAGVTAVHSSLELKRHVGQINPTGSEPEVFDLGTADLTANNDLDYGVNLGFQADLTPALTLGMNYRSRVSISYDGTADFTFTGTGTPLDSVLVGLFPKDQSASTDLGFPATLVLALGVTPSPRFSAEMDLGWVQWSSFDRLPLRFKDTSLNQTLIEEWKDTFFYRFGAEIGLRDDLDLRLGYYYDETPQPSNVVSPLLPDNNRTGFSLGVGKSWGRVRADLFGLYLIIPDRSTGGNNRDGFEGTYANGVQIAGLTLGYRY
jgi:long-chain fatty acid transport protein